MLYGGGDDPGSPVVTRAGALGDTEERERIGFRSTVREDDLGRAHTGAQRACDVAAGCIERLSGASAKRMERVWISTRYLGDIIARIASIASGRNGVEAA